MAKKSKALIIVESPAKIKTLKKFLGSEYSFESSIGHIRDLPQKEFGIDVENGFEPTYQTMPDKEQVIDKLIKAAKQAEIVYLSPDPDREGEAIAWHISQILPKNTKIERITFNAFTKKEVQEAIGHPRNIDQALVNAQQARRLLDRIVGYKISPILNRRIQRGRDSGVSAGRVQSVALKLVVDREKAIEAFVPIEYWNLGAEVKCSQIKSEAERNSFRANLYSYQGQKIDKEANPEKGVITIPNQETAHKIIQAMTNQPLKVIEVEKKEKKRNPPPPFITSTLQQEASRHFGYSAARTMSIAQSLYEGIDLGKEGPEGLITYMRTDSFRIAPEAISDVRNYIKETFGKTFLPNAAREFASKKSAQDAHEAIRPTNLQHPPEFVAPYLTQDQQQLYSLIWKRFIASQMESALFDTVGADISCGKEVILRATGSTLKFNGYLAIYQEKQDDDEEEGENILPELKEGDLLTLLELLSEQAFTRPPPRFTEASLVKELEKSGIGRPSTYASIMNKIQSREYTIKENKRLKPTELGRIIAQMLEISFEKIMNIDFTADMENNLELVADNKKDWKELLADFWKDFEPSLEIAEKEAHVPKIPTDLICPKCSSNLQKVWFRSKYFYGCTKYPDCDYSAPIEEIEFNKEDYAADFDWDQPCPLCNSAMKVRHGPYGSFLGCTSYPKCKGIVKIPKKGEIVIPLESLPDCPAVGCPGKLMQRRSRYGKTFFSCSTFPECDVILNDLNQTDEKYHNHPRTPYAKKEKRGAKKSKVTAKKKTTASKTRKSPSTEFTLSKPLADLLNAKTLPRKDILKQLWDYIRAHNLQDKKDGRLINPDEKLSKLFGSAEPISMFKLAGIISHHIEK